MTNLKRFIKSLFKDTQRANTGSNTESKTESNTESNTESKTQVNTGSNTETSLSFQHQNNELIINDTDFSQFVDFKTWFDQFECKYLTIKDCVNVNADKIISICEQKDVAYSIENSSGSYKSGTFKGNGTISNRGGTSRFNGLKLR